jgi:hypothetical protein
LSSEASTIATENVENAASEVLAVIVDELARAAVVVRQGWRKLIPTARL